MFYVVWSVPVVMCVCFMLCGVVCVLCGAVCMSVITMFESRWCLIIIRMGLLQTQEKF